MIHAPPILLLSGNAERCRGRARHRDRHVQASGRRILALSRVEHRAEFRLHALCRSSRARRAPLHARCDRRSSLRRSCSASRARDCRRSCTGTRSAARPARRTGRSTPAGSCPGRSVSYVPSAFHLITIAPSRILRRCGRQRRVEVTRRGLCERAGRQGQYANAYQE